MKVCCKTFSSRPSDLKFSRSNKESESELIFTKNTIIDGGSTAAANTAVTACTAYTAMLTVA